MFKTAINMIAGAMICALVSAAYAVVGITPINGGGPALIDQSWLLGLSGGQNFAYQYGIAAAGTTQATGTQLPAGVFLVEVDTASSSTGVNLPPAYPGVCVRLYNAGLSTLTVYPAVANNPVTGIQDTINGSTSTTQTTTTAKLYCAAKAGIYGAQ